jgi:hypothetical protein
MNIALPEMRLFSALREAVVTMLAAIATMLCTLAIAPGPAPAIFGVVLSLSLSRSHLDRDWRQRLEAAVALPAIGFAALGVGWLLQQAPWLGALTFVAGMFVSIWLRRYGATAQRIGSLIALPFVALLVTPPLSDHAGRLPAWLVPIVIALLALLWVTVLHALARRIGLLPPRSTQMPAPVEAARASVAKPAASTRMAVQMAFALALSFTIGYVFFAERWSWIVLTAFIVLSGSRGRLDVAYKSVLRVAGAAGGTILAMAASAWVPAGEVSSVMLILTAVFLGVWLRPLSYAWWALFITIALALLQGFAAAPADQVLFQRLEEIIIGAILAVATAWWLLPVRSTGVLRLRLGEALAALGTTLQTAAAPRSTDGFVAAVARVEQLAPAFRASRYITRRRRSPQPADWIDALVACRSPAVALIERDEAPVEVRRAIGAARKALLEPETLLSALHDLQRSLAR